MKFDDQPIEKSEDDILLRAPIAKNLAEGIRKYAQNKSFVIGIQGEWGDGKTSFINMMLASFEEKELQEDFIVIHFNPWYFTGEDQILKQFCDTFADKLSTKSNGNERIVQAAKKIKKIAALVKPFKDIANFAGLSIGVPGMGTILRGSVDKVADFAKDLEEAYQPSEDLFEIKNQIEDALSDFNKKIIVIVDDIDRLNKDEVYEVFRLVKIIADFPKTFYILSYDKKRVSIYLKEKGYDINFIEKIIQQEMDLPAPEKSIAYELFINGLNQISDEYGIKSNERMQRYFREIDYAGLSQAFQNLRSVKRVLNVINLEFGLYPNEVNFIDFSLLCLLRVYAPDVYKHIQEHGVNYLNGQPLTDEKQKIYEDFEKIIKPEEYWAISIIGTMFPTAGSGNYGHGYGSDIVSEWIVDKRICTDEYFKRYFDLSISSDEFRESEYIEIYNSTSNAESFREILQRYKIGNNIRKMLGRLMQRVENFPKENIPNVISVLLDEADYLKEKTLNRYSMDSSNEAFYLCLKLLMSFPVEMRLQAFQRAVEGTQFSMIHLLRFIDSVGQDHGHVDLTGSHTSLPITERFLSESEFQKSQNVVIERFSKSNIQDLFVRKDFTPIWFILKDHKRELAEKIRGDLLGIENGFLKSVSLFCGYVRSSSRDAYRELNFESLKKFLENEKTSDELIQEIEEALRNSNDEELNEIVREGLSNAIDSVF